MVSTQYLYCRLAVFDRDYFWFLHAGQLALINALHCKPLIREFFDYPTCFLLR